MTRRWMHCGCVAAAAVACLITFSAAAPVLKDDSVVAADAEKPLVRTKRADEIIFTGQQDVDGARIKKSDEPVTGSDVGAKTDDVSKLAAEEESKKKETESKSDGTDTKEETENIGQIDTSGPQEPNEFKGSDKPSDGTNDVDERAGSRVWDEENDYIADSEQRRRRRAVAAAAGSKENSQRHERSAGQPAVAMVAENMPVPMTSAAGGGARLQRAKRELDADEIRDLLDSREVALVPSSDELATFEYNDYGPSADEQQEEIVVNGARSDEAPYEEEGAEYEDNDSSNYFTSDDRRPKRRIDDDDEEEEAYEEAEREVVRELLAERAAEETRQALLAYLSSSEEAARGRYSDGGGAVVYRPDERFGEVDADDEQTAFADDDDEFDGQTDDDSEFEEGGRQSESEEIDENDDRLSSSQFLGDDGQQSTVDDVVEQKRFSYPYTYEPYGGRWGALVPGAKRSDRDPYDRLYRLAEALSRPSIGSDDDYKK